MLFPNFKILFWKKRSFLKFFKVIKKRKLIDNLSKWSSIFWSGLFHYFPPSSLPSGAAWTIQWSTKHEKSANQFQKWNRPFEFHLPTAALSWFSLVVVISYAYFSVPPSSFLLQLCVFVCVCVCVRGLAQDHRSGARVLRSILFINS